ncbi:tetratricopeptide repeat protein [Salegentibacter sp. F188]|uniref:Tetratricopeptide repeat protein n=1 Tax=Autumnicola patrickiae TaxID=3075591 RepID=A0ABU3E5J7_9FLAO|nr:tetratricopeptide repeat protein [Salegentibacter sp. F188]MDT0691267.1 tetratricopeptide repeat protein [Salegentibacter sp. F188]
MKNLFYILFFFSASLFAQNENLFEEANSAYAEGNYEQAIEKYEQILASGEASAALYYNLGNAHYKLNHIAPSIYNYEKALMLQPRDSDINNNIEFARNMALDAIEEVEQTGFQKSINSFISRFSADFWAKFAIFFSLLFAALFLAYYYMNKPLVKRLLFGGSVVMLICCIATIYFAYSKEEIQENNQFAIIFSSEAQVRNEPSVRGEEAFVLHEGTKTKVLETYQEWIKIELANGDQGWILRNNLKTL